MKRVLFICTHNSARSQIAEGLVNSGKYSSDWIAFSAGTQRTKINPMAIQSMKLIDIDISAYRSKLIDEFIDHEFDMVVTVCDDANNNCPYFPNSKQQIHAGFKDPSTILGTDEDKLEAFIQTRNLIIKWIENKLQ